MVSGMYCMMDFLFKNTKPYYWRASFSLLQAPYRGCQVLSVNYRNDDFNNECYLYLASEGTLTVGYWCPPLIWRGMSFLFRRYTCKLE